MAKRKPGPKRKKAVKAGTKVIGKRKRTLYRGAKGGKFYRTKSGRTYV